MWVKQLKRDDLTYLVEPSSSSAPAWKLGHPLNFLDTLYNLKKKKFTSYLKSQEIVSIYKLNCPISHHSGTFYLDLQSWLSSSFHLGSNAERKAEVREEGARGHSSLSHSVLLPFSPLLLCKAPGLEHIGPEEGKGAREFFHEWSYWVRAHIWVFQNPHCRRSSSSGLAMMTLPSS